jgi:AbrB family looped-hinge helix DNA binding protein
MAARISAKGRVTLPKEIRTALHLAAGDHVEFRVSQLGEIVVRKVSAPTDLTRARNGQVRRRAAELSALLRRLS